MLPKLELIEILSTEVLSCKTTDGIFFLLKIPHQFLKQPLCYFLLEVIEFVNPAKIFQILMKSSILINRILRVVENSNIFISSSFQSSVSHNSKCRYLIYLQAINSKLFRMSKRISFSNLLCNIIGIQYLYFF